MKIHLLAFLLLTCLFSCMDYSTVKSVGARGGTTNLQDFYSPCCGSCGQRIITEADGGNTLYALLVLCNIEDEYGPRCSPSSIGTQKQVIRHIKKNLRSISWYRPVYDTIALLKQYPKTPRDAYFDSAAFTHTILPLDKMDSLLFKNYFQLSEKRECEGKYLNLIKGFAFVKETIANNRYTQDKIKRPKEVSR